MIFFYTGQLQNERERPDMKRKYINADKLQLWQINTSKMK